MQDYLLCATILAATIAVCSSPTLLGISQVRSLERVPMSNQRSHVWLAVWGNGLAANTGTPYVREGVVTCSKVLRWTISVAVGVRLMSVKLARSPFKGSRPRKRSPASA